MRAQIIIPRKLFTFICNLLELHFDRFLKRRYFVVGILEQLIIFITEFITYKDIHNLLTCFLVCLVTLLLFTHIYPNCATIIYWFTLYMFSSVFTVFSITMYWLKCTVQVLCICFLFWLGLGFELRALCLESRHSTTQYRF
jgi:hypothetical protein